MAECRTERNLKPISSTCLQLHPSKHSIWVPRWKHLGYAGYGGFKGATHSPRLTLYLSICLSISLIFYYFLPLPVSLPLPLSLSLSVSPQAVCVEICLERTHRLFIYINIHLVCQVFTFSLSHKHTKMKFQSELRRH